MQHILVLCLIVLSAVARNPIESSEADILIQKKEPLLTILERYAPSDTSSIYPQQAAALDTLRKQLVAQKPFTTDRPPAEKWSLIKTFLEMSGASLIHRNGFIRVIQNNQIEGGASNREVLPVFTQGSSQNKPTDDTRIRSIYSLKTIQVPPAGHENNHPLSKMLKQFMSEYGSLVFDPSTNSVIISDLGSHVSAIEHILNEFEKKGIKEEVAYVQLAYLKATDVVKVFESLKEAAAGNLFENSMGAFTQDTRIVANTIRNGIVIMGRQSHVNRISEFIRDTLDLPPSKGESILHFYSLNYLDAEKFAPILTRITSTALDTNKQATEEMTGPFFKGVAIVAEPSEIPAPQIRTEEVILEQKGAEEITGLDTIATNGGNRLIVAARQKDWKIIKALIERLDKPQPQVLLEVLIAEFSYDQRTLLAGTNRSKTDTPLVPNGVQFLASHISSVSSVLGSNPTQLAQDLLQVIGPGSVTNQIGPGSLLLSINDPKTPGIFGLLQVLDRVLCAKINAHPYITIMNHQEGTIDTTQTRRTTGELVTTTDGSFTIPIEDVEASITVKAIPHIVSSNKVLLAIGFLIEDFEGGQFNRRVRELKTTATLKSGEILAMGGLLRVDNTDEGTYTPLFGRLPLVGTFFRRTSTETIRRNITLFVAPTIIDAYKRSSWTKRTVRAIKEQHATEEATEKIFVERDPIYRLYLKKKRTSSKGFIEQGANMPLSDDPKLLNQPQKKPFHLFDPEELKRVLASKRAQPLIKPALGS